MHLVFLCLVLTSLVTGATTWSPFPPSHHHHRVVVEFAEESNGNTKVSVSENKDSGIGVGEFFGKYSHKLVSLIEKTKNMVAGKTHEVSSNIKNFGEQAKEEIDEAVGEVGDPKVKFSEKFLEMVKVIGEKVKVMARNTIGTFMIGDSTEGTLKDSVLKMEQWDVIDSPKRIGEDIGQNASRKVQEGVEEVKETVEIVKETSLHDLLTRSTRKVTALVDKIQTVISWCHLFGFSTAYGMGVWVTFFTSYVLGKSLPKRQCQTIVNKLYMVYYKAMTYCVGAALIGYLVSRGRRVFFLCNKMEIFQGFNLLSAFFMSFTNMKFLKPRVTKLIVEREKMKEEGGKKSVVAAQLKKLNRYSSTLNVSTMVVLTWHMAYIGQLLQARH